MTKYASDRNLALAPYDWAGFVATLDLEEEFVDQYRVIPLDLPLTTAEMAQIRRGHNSVDMSDKWDLEFHDDKLICLRNWNGICAYIIRFVPDGEHYRICDVLENCHPDQWDGHETTPGYGSGWALLLIDFLLGRGYFEWRGEDDFDGWFWHSPPKRPRRKIRQMAKWLPSIRPQLQRDFVRWLDACQIDFRVPVHLGKRTRKCWEMHFEGIAPQIKAILVGNGSLSELVIAAEWQGECWDLFASFEASPYRDGLVYFCALCEEGKRQVFGSRQEVWCDHLFSPFRDWVNKELAPANWLVLQQIEGSSCAKLAIERPADAAGRVIIPLRDTRQ